MRRRAFEEEDASVRQVTETREGPVDKRIAHRLTMALSDKREVDIGQFYAQSIRNL
jgi:hypothetical protein